MTCIANCCTGVRSLHPERARFRRFRNGVGGHRWPWRCWLGGRFCWRSALSRCPAGPRGMAGIRISEVSGTVPGTLYPGVHFVTPLVEDVALFDTRDQVFTTGVSEDGKSAAANVSSKSQLLDVQAKEGLTLGLAITV